MRGLAVEFALLSVALGVPSPAVCQVYTRPDSARIANAVDAGALIVHWIETTTDRSEQAVYLRNTSNEPIQVTSYEIYDCQNLRGNVCGVHAPGPVIKPGKTVELVVVSQSFRYEAWSFRYRFHTVFLRPDPATGNAAMSPVPCIGSCTASTPMHLDSMTPSLGATVAADSVFRATLHYQVPDFQPGRWEITVLFQSANSTTLRSAMKTDTVTGILPDSAGVYHLEQRFLAVWNDARIARPFTVFISLNRKEGNGFSRSIATLGPYQYPVSTSSP
jgi:hypothetical protein